jgi:protein-tyrosine phosphatase
MAQGVFEAAARREGLADEITVDSAGTHAYYTAGEPPDPGAQEIVLSRDIDISAQRARLLTPEDCEPEVPDPYGRGPGNFEHVLGLIEDAAEGLLGEVRTRRL